MAYLPINPEVVESANAQFPNKPVPNGTRVWFWTEKKPYKVVGSTDRYIICTKPFNLRKTFQYSILDLERGHRGPINLIFGIIQDLAKPEGVQDLLSQLQNSDVEVSHRHGCNIHIDKIVFP